MPNENDNETNGAKLRNALSPYVLYFQLKDKLKKGEIDNDKIEEIQKILEKVEKTCFDDLDKMIKLSKSVE